MIERKFARAIKRAGGKLFFIGGSVRDELLGHVSPTADTDFVVFGMDGDTLSATLRPFGEVVTTGNDFAVTKLRADGEEYDFALARQETSTGKGYHDVVVETGADVTMEQDAERRDLTVNAIYKDVLTGEMVDPLGIGLSDMRNRIFRHASARFVESNERPLRLAQMAARYPTFSIAPETVKVCHTMVGQFDRIPREQLRQQFTKLLVKGRKPGRGIQVLKDTNWLPLFPALSALDGIPQDPRHHPEGDALTHTMQVCDAMAGICNREGITGDRRFKLMLAALVHDFGKATTTEIIADGHITSRGHAAETATAESFMAQIDVPKKMRRAVLTLVREHMAHAQAPTERSVRRLARRLWDATRSDAPAHSATIEELCLLMEADIRGHGGMVDKQAMANIAAIRRVAAEQKVTAKPAKPLVDGHMLIAAFDLHPKRDGRHIGQILRALREAQDAGQIKTSDEAMSLANKLV